MYYELQRKTYTKKCFDQWVKSWLKQFLSSRKYKIEIWLGPSKEYRRCKRYKRTYHCCYKVTSKWPTTADFHWKYKDSKYNGSLVGFHRWHNKLGRMSTKYANVLPEFSERHNKLGRTSSKNVDTCANFFKWNHQLGHKSSKRTRHRWLIIATGKMPGAPQVGPDSSQEVPQKTRQANLSSQLARCQAPLCITSGLFAKAMKRPWRGKTSNKANNNRETRATQVHQVALDQLDHLTPGLVTTGSKGNAKSARTSSSIPSFSQVGTQFQRGVAIMTIMDCHYHLSRAPKTICKAFSVTVSASFWQAKRQSVNPKVKQAKTPPKELQTSGVAQYSEPSKQQSLQKKSKIQTTNESGQVLQSTIRACCLPAYSEHKHCLPSHCLAAKVVAASNVEMDTPYTLCQKHQEVTKHEGGSKLPIWGGGKLNHSKIRRDKIASRPEGDSKLVDASQQN